MATKAQKTLGLIGLGLAGLFGYLFYTRKEAAADALAPTPGSGGNNLPAPGAPRPPSEDAGGTQEEAAPEMPINAAMVVSGDDQVPDNSVAVIALPTGTANFKKMYDADTKTVRWLTVPGGTLRVSGSYKNIANLSTNHPVKLIYTATGLALWDNFALTQAGQQYFGLPAGAPLAALL